MKKKLLISLLSLSILQIQTTPITHKHLVQGYIKKHTPAYKHLIHQQIITLIASYYLSKFAKKIPSQHEENLQKLLKKYDGDGEKVLRLLSHNNRYKTLKSFIKRYPDINLNHQSPTTGDTPLHYTTKKSALDSFQVLIDHGALIHIENNLGESVWDIITDLNDHKKLPQFYNYATVANIITFNPKGLNVQNTRTPKPEGLYITMPCREPLVLIEVAALVNKRHLNIDNILYIGPGVFLPKVHKSFYPTLFQDIAGTSPSLAEAMHFFRQATFDVMDIIDIRSVIEKTKQKQTSYHKVWEYSFKKSPQIVSWHKTGVRDFNDILEKMKRSRCSFKTNFIHQDIFKAKFNKHYGIIFCLNVATLSSDISNNFKKYKNLLPNLTNALNQQGILVLDSTLFCHSIIDYFDISPDVFDSNKSFFVNKIKQELKFSASWIVPFKGISKKEAYKSFCIHFENEKGHQVSIQSNILITKL